MFMGSGGRESVSGTNAPASAEDVGPGPAGPSGPCAGAMATAAEHWGEGEPEAKEPQWFQSGHGCLTVTACPAEGLGNLRPLWEGLRGGLQGLIADLGSAPPRASVLQVRPALRPTTRSAPQLVLAPALAPPPVQPFTDSWGNTRL